VGIERPSSRDQVKNFKLNSLAGACVEEFVRLVHPVQLEQAWRLLLPQCGRGKRRRTERIGAIANESGVFVGPLDPNRDFLIFDHESSSRS
jgi:hypothetical protein